jgi:rhamnosyltransferase
VISIVIPAKDGGADLVRCLDAISAQEVDEEVEVVVIDSSSTDGSSAEAERRGAIVHTIPAGEFHHGRTRNLGASLARGDVLVFTSQDAYAATDSWLRNLVAPFGGDHRVAGVYGRQLPHHDARPPERYFLDFLYGAAPRTQRLVPDQELDFEITLFSNVNSAMTRKTWQEYPFAEDIVMSEDQEWSRRVLLAGLEIVYEPKAAVHHSHPYSLASAFRRFFDSGVSAERSYVDDDRASRRALWKAAARYSRGEVAWLWATGHRRWIPYAALLEATKFAGLQLGRQHELLPVGVRRRFSDYPEFWS